MPSETRVLILVQFGDDHGYPVYWIVNRSHHGIRTLTFWAGSLGFGENPHQQARGIPPRSVVRIPYTLFVEPGPAISVVEEVVWEDGVMESFFRLPTPSSEGEEFARLTTANVEVQFLEPLHSLEPEDRREVWCGLCKAMGWQEHWPPSLKK